MWGQDCVLGEEEVTPGQSSGWCWSRQRRDAKCALLFYNWRVERAEASGSGSWNDDVVSNYLLFNVWLCNVR